VNYNGKAYLQRCLEYVKKQSLRPSEVLVVDNASTDGSLEMVQELFPEFGTLKNEANLGFAMACNQGIEVCEKKGAKYVALLNPDAFPEYNWLAQLVETAERNPHCGSVASRMMMEEDPSRIDGLGDAYHMFGFGWRRGHGELLQDGPQGDLDSNMESRVFGACAGAALYRVSALNDVGNFDADFFCYMEDVDLAYRLNLAGYTCMLNQRACVNHVGSGITGYRSEFSTYYGQRNLPWVFVKNTPPGLFWLLLPGQLSVNLASLVVAAFRGQFRVVWRAKRDAMALLGDAWRKRASIQTTRVETISSIWKLFDKSLVSRNLFRGAR